MATNTHKIRGYFTTPATERERLTRLRESIVWLAEQEASRRAASIRAIDEQLAALDAQEAQDVQSMGNRHERCTNRANRPLCAIERQSGRRRMKPNTLFRNELVRCNRPGLRGRVLTLACEVQTGKRARAWKVEFNQTWVDKRGVVHMTRASAIVAEWEVVVIGEAA